MSAAPVADAAVPVSRLAGSWEAVPVVLALSGLALVLFLQAFARLRRRGRADHAPWTRLPLFLAGLALLTLPLVSPLDTVGDDYLLSGHMLQHVLIGDAGPALLVTALRGPLLFFFVPATILGPLARLSPLRSFLAFLLRPRVSLAVWALTLGCWHVPAAYDYTLDHQTVHDLEHLSFAVAGLLVWTQLVDPARRGALSPARRIGLAALLFSCGLALSDTLVFSFRTLYPAYANHGQRLLGIGPLLDQQLAGVVMMVEQLVSLGICCAFLVVRLRRARTLQAGELIAAQPT